MIPNIIDNNVILSAQVFPSGIYNISDHYLDLGRAMASPACYVMQRLCTQNQDTISIVGYSTD